MVKTAAQQLHHYFTQLSEAEQSSVLQLLKTMASAKDRHPERISLERYNEEIEQALADIEAGRVYSQEEVEKQAKDW